MTGWQGFAIGLGVALLCVSIALNYLAIFKGTKWARLVIALEKLRREVQSDIDAEKIKAATVREIAVIRTTGKSG